MRNLLVFFICMFTYNNIYSQDRQTPWNIDKKIIVITNEINIQYKIFNEYPNLVEARLYQKDSISFYSDILVLDSQNMNYKISKVLTITDLNNIKEKLNSIPKVVSSGEISKDTIYKKSSIEENLKSDTPDQSGRNTLLWWTTISTMFIHAPLWIIGADISFESSSALTGTTYLISTAIGYGLPSMLTSNKEVTKAEAELCIWGLNYGVLNKFLFGYAIDNNFIDFKSPSRFRPEVLLLSLGGIAQGLEGYCFAKNNKLTLGESNLLMHSNISGIFTGLGLYFLTYSAINEFKNPNNEFFESKSNINIACATALVTAFAKMYYSYQQMKKYNYTTADVTTISLAGLIGTSWGGYFTYELINSNEKSSPTLITAILLASGIASEYFANEYVTKCDIPDSKSSDISLSAFIGGLSGVAIDLTASTGTDSPRLMILAPLIGSYYRLSLGS